MQKENVEEYRTIRHEMLNVKDCITKYIGYVFGGSGAVIYGMSRVDPRSPDIVNGIAVLAFSISFMISLMLLMLFYKFSSHNRFAGFCKLLNHERFDSKKSSRNARKKKYVESKGGDSIFSWEVNVGRLRRVEGKVAKMLKNAEDMIIAAPNNKTVKIKIRHYAGKKSRAGIKKRLKGFVMIVNTMRGKEQTGSWGFPPLVVAILGVLSFGFLFTGYYITCFLSAHDWKLVLFASFISLLQFRMWMHFSGKLYDLMSGRATVEAYYWKLLPIRAMFLNEHGITPRYISDEV